MHKKSFDATAERIFVINRSLGLILALLALHTLALVAVAITSLPVTIKMILVCLALASMASHLRQYNLQINPTHLSYHPLIGWKKENLGNFYSIQILPSTVLTPFLIIIHYQLLSPNTACKTLTCFKDAMSPAAFRQLTVQLKITGALSIKNNPEKS